MLSFLSEFWMFLRVRKKFWLLPIFITVSYTHLTLPTILRV